MKRRTWIELGFGIATLAVIVAAWPRITPTGVATCSVMSGGPGVRLTLDHGPCMLGVALGQSDHSFVLGSRPPADLRNLESVLAVIYPELDLAPGRSGQGEGIFSSSKYTPAHQQTVSSPGYSTGWLDVTIAWHRQAAMQIVLAPPPSLEVGVTTPWCLLAAVGHLDIEIEWRQTPETLEVRRRGRPGAKPVRWGAGILNVGNTVGDASSRFGADGKGEVATLPLVKAGLREGEANVHINITASGPDISIQVTVK